MVKVTFTLDDQTVERLRRTASRLAKPQSYVVREAVREYETRATKLGDELDDVSVRLLRRVPGPKLIRVGKRLVAHPTVRAAKLPAVDLADLVARERDRWPW